eukprot:SAG11_NODE_2584_length_3195_cov_2.145026_2_plen_464_part_00
MPRAGTGTGTGGGREPFLRPSGVNSVDGDASVMNPSRRSCNAHGLSTREETQLEQTPAHQPHSQNPQHGAGEWQVQLSLVAQSMRAAFGALADTGDRATGGHTAGSAPPGTATVARAGGVRALARATSSEMAMSIDLEEGDAAGQALRVLFGSDGHALDRHAAYRHACGGGSARSSASIEQLATSISAQLAGTPSAIRRGELLRLLQSGDVDNDGSISFEEFEALLDDAEHKHRVGLAALHVKDALLGQPITYEKTHRAIAAFGLYTSKNWERAYAVTAVLHLLLAFFENPTRFDHSEGRAPHGFAGPPPSLPPPPPPPHTHALGAQRYCPQFLLHHPTATTGRPNDLVTHWHFLRTAFWCACHCAKTPASSRGECRMRHGSSEHQLNADRSIAPRVAESAAFCVYSYDLHLFYSFRVRRQMLVFASPRDVPGASAGATGAPKSAVRRTQACMSRHQLGRVCI